jgi:hypothetical protein
MDATCPPREVDGKANIFSSRIITPSEKTRTIARIPKMSSFIPTFLNRGKDPLFLNEINVVPRGGRTALPIAAFESIQVEAMAVEPIVTPLYRL